MFYFFEFRKQTDLSQKPWFILYHVIIGSKIICPLLSRVDLPEVATSASLDRKEGWVVF